MRTVAAKSIRWTVKFCFSKAIEYSVGVGQNSTTVWSRKADSRIRADSGMECFAQERQPDPRNFKGVAQFS